MNIYKYNVKRNILIMLVLLFAVISFTESHLLSGQRKRLGVSKLVPVNVSEKIAADITLKLYTMLKAIKKDSVVCRKIDGITKSVNRKLIGRISKFGKTVCISVSVVDAEKAGLLFKNTIMIEDESSLDEKLKQLAEDICNSSKIW